MPRAYDLDRLDLTVDQHARRRGAARWHRAAARPARPPAPRPPGCTGKRLLNEGDDPGKVIYSFTLFERGEHANFLRVQTDNYDQPLDINEGAKLDLGSTAKLRTLVTYLEIVAELQARWGDLRRRRAAARSKSARRTARPRGRASTCCAPSDKSLHAMLEAAMERTLFRQARRRLLHRRRPASLRELRARGQRPRR